MRTLGPINFRHPTAGFSLPLPPDWEQYRDPQPGVSLIAVEPEQELLPFRSNVVVTVDPRQPGEDLHQWQAAIDEQLPLELPNYLLLDVEDLDDPYPMYRRLAHYAGQETGSVTMEQWSTVVDGFGYTLTCSITTTAYDSLADIFAEIAAGFRCGSMIQE